MFELVKRVLLEDNFLRYDVLLHYPIRQLIKDFSKLDEEEAKYASNPLTHLDFLIYNKLGKVPVLGIEVDGFEFHKEEKKVLRAHMVHWHIQCLRKTECIICRAGK